MGAAEPLLLSIRRLFEEKNSFQEAKAFMASTPHLSPAYFILGGVEGDDGAIVTSGGIKVPCTLVLSSLTHLLAPQC